MELTSQLHIRKTDHDPPNEISTSVDPPSEIVSVAVKLSPPALEVVASKSVMVMEGGGLELEVNVVVDVVGAILELELEVAEVVDVPAMMLGSGALELAVTGGTFGDVVLRAGHPEDPLSRRTGQ